MSLLYGIHRIRMRSMAVANTFMKLQCTLFCAFCRTRRAQIIFENRTKIRSLRNPLHTIAYLHNPLCVRRLQDRATNKLQFRHNILPLLYTTNEKQSSVKKSNTLNVTPDSLLRDRDVVCAFRDRDSRSLNDDDDDHCRGPPRFRRKHILHNIWARAQRIHNICGVVFVFCGCLLR